MLNKPESSSDKKEPVVVKKYANRRLYNTETSTYVTLDDLAAMVRAERDFVVYDAKSGEDLTHSVLTQIIVEQESRAGTQTLLPVPFLRQLIRFYGDTMERLVPSYLQVSLETLAKEQDRFRKQFTSAFTPHGAFEAYQEQARKNLAMFEQAMSIFTPFNPGGKPGAGGDPAAKGQPSPAAGGAPAAPADQSPSPKKPAQQPEQRRPANELDELKSQLAAMQAKLEKLSNGSGS
ncbi:MAG: polyhydroxyalkanoate synthesis repressor PhaR [Hyphomicrobiaceae bacterium]|nr:polyhydroxyalkanoate synthesis repressor PhaR [Hyphomicrobiaceae bacterium]